MASAATAKRKLMLRMSASLDGFAAGPKGALDWVFRTSGDASKKRVVNMIREADAHMMGSRSYDDMAAFWPFSDTPFAAR